MTKDKKFYGFDCENFNKRLTLGSIVGKDFKFTFYNARDFINMICSKRFRSCIIFATNLEYDLGVIINNFKDCEKNFSYNYRGGRLISARYKTKNHSVTFADTFNFSPTSVANLGKLISLNKLTTPKSWNPETVSEWDYLLWYNLRDSEISFRFMEYLRDGFRALNGDIKITVSSTALHIWKNNYYKKELIPSKFIEEEQSAYYGGRTEAFKRGFFDRNVRVYDFSSSYPKSMRDVRVPIPSTARRGFDPNFIEEGISFVEVFCSKSLKIPLLPIRLDGKLIFPTGSFSGWYTHLELRKARELGYKIKVVKSILYDTEFMFKDYVNDYYGLKCKYKREGNKIMVLIAKLLLNSLYGKFATKLEVEKVVHKANLSSQEYISLMERGANSCGDFLSYKEVMPYIPKYIMPIVSAYITSDARVRLYEQFELAGFDNVIYCDTDSVFTTSRLKVGRGLGAMELEYVGSMYVVRPKVYCPLNDLIDSPFKSIKVKGLGRVVRDTGMFVDFILGRKRINYTRFSRMKESRRRGFYYGEEIDVFKELNLNDEKRVWVGDFDPCVSSDSVPLCIY